jgi:hypothetical protein
MYDAEELGRDGALYRFRDIDALARRIAGRTATWQEVHESTQPAQRRVQILRPNPLAGGSDIVTTVLVPVEAIRVRNGDGAL